MNEQSGTLVNEHSGTEVNEETSDLRRAEGRRRYAKGEFDTIEVYNAKRYTHYFVPDLAVMSYVTRP